jgi:hypothetical protein
MNFFRVRAPTVLSKPKTNVEENLATFEVIDVSHQDISPELPIMTEVTPPNDLQPTTAVDPLRMPVPDAQQSESPISAVSQIIPPQQETVCDITSDELPLETCETVSPPSDSPTDEQVSDSLPSVTKKRIRKKTQKFSEEYQPVAEDSSRSPSFSPEIVDRLEGLRQKAAAIVDTLAAEHRSVTLRLSISQSLIQFIGKPLWWLPRL